MIFGLLSWYDEPVQALALCVDGLAGAGVGHLVAVDGAYALFPDASAVSPLDQHSVLAGTTQLLGMGLTVHVPRAPWQGNEIEKRGALFALGWAAAAPGDWFWVIDADEIVVEAPEDLCEQLAATDRDVAIVLMRDVVTGDEFAGRRLYRAQRIRVEGNHYTYLADDDTVLFEGNGTPREVAPLDLTDCVVVEHRQHLRPRDRQAAKSGYYDARDAAGLERGPCERCGARPTRRIPGRWTFPAGGPPQAHMTELCDAHAAELEHANRAVLIARGLDPDSLTWREKYAPLPERKPELLVP